MKNKNTIRNLIVITALAIHACFRALAASSTPQTGGPPAVYIGLSPYYADPEIPKVKEALTRFILGAPPGTRVLISDAQELQTIARFDVPVLTYDSPANRARILGQPLTALLRWFNQQTNAPAPAELKGTGSMSVPEWLDQVSGEPGDRSRSIILLGSPIYRSAREPAFSMEGTRIPTDGHFTVGRVESPYGTLERRGRLSGATIAWWYVRESAWDNPLQRTLVGRFWNLYAAQLGARMSYFGPDVVSAFGATTSPPASMETFKINEDDTKPEMRIAKPRQVPTWLPTPNTGDAVTDSKYPIPSSGLISNSMTGGTSDNNRRTGGSLYDAQSEPARQTFTISGGSSRVINNGYNPNESDRVIYHGSNTAPVPSLDMSRPITSPLDLGIMWNSPDRAVDCDLYVKANRTAKELWFRHVRTPEGEYIHDWTAPNAAGDFESVRLRPPVDLNQVEAWVNLFKGQGPITGRVVLHFDNNVYSGTFTVPASRGNGGADASSRETSPNWTRINLKTLVGEIRQIRSF